MKRILCDYCEAPIEPHYLGTCDSYMRFKFANGESVNVYLRSASGREHICRECLIANLKEKPAITSS